MTRAITEPLLRALVDEARDDAKGARVLGVVSVPHWSGPDRLEGLGVPVRVVPCVSALAVREALADDLDAGNGDLLVILTDRSEEELGREVVARLWRNRLLRPTGWDTARRLFRVAELDPALADERWLVDLLVEVAPLRGYPPPPSGLLDEPTAWRTLLRHGLRLEVDGPTPQDLLAWAQTEAARSALAGPVGQYREQIAARLDQEVGPLSSHLLRFAAEGRGGDLVPFGLVCGVLWPREGQDSPAALIARVRFEAPLGEKGLREPVAHAWAAASAALVREAVDSDEGELVAGWLSRAEEVLARIEATGLIKSSDVLPGGFDARLIRAGEDLSKALDEPTSERLTALQGAVDTVERHLRARRDADRDRVERLTMALRLVRRMTSPPEAGTADLASRALRFVADGAWVDAAWAEVGQGETVDVLASAYGRLVEHVDQERRARDRAFGTALAGWSTVLPVESKPLLPIERVLEQVVAPVAKCAPTLLLVLDGMSWAEATRLWADIRQAGWREQGPRGEPLPPVVAALPTITMVSRATLLSGKLTEGGQDVERAGFEENPALRAVSGGHPPRLFHKADLKIEHGRIAPDVRDAILDPAMRVVGVVVNAVDDHLDKGGQIRPAEGIRGVRPLRPLLDAAAEAGRAVVLASDHGHVLEHGSKVRIHAGAGERWRPATEPAGPDELEIAGPRVMRGGGKIVVPVVDAIRYMAAGKRGYHGGATPEEVLAPLVVLTAANLELDGYEPVPVRRPLWWDREGAAVRAVMVPRAVEAEPIVAPNGQGMLFAEGGGAAAPTFVIDGWIGDLLRSPVLEEQRQSAGRQALDDESVARFLAVLDAADDVAPAAVLADAMALPPSRLRTKLEALRRMLNVDGYAVLSIEPDGTARLNRGLLRTQFQIDA